MKVTLLSGEITLHSLEVLSLEGNSRLHETRRGPAEDDFITIVEAEHPSYKSDTTINSASKQESRCRSFDTHRSLLNTFGGVSWKNGGQTVFYEFEVPSDGYYNYSLQNIFRIRSRR